MIHSTNLTETQNARGYLLTTLVLLVGLLVLTQFFSERMPLQSQSAGKKLNLVLISVDSLRQDHMGMYGYFRDTTPNIDSFAKDAVVFNNYFSTSYLTPISEMSVQTGLYPFTNGIINFQSVLSGNVETLAELLQRNGWQTAAMGSSGEFRRKILKASFSRGFDFYQDGPINPLTRKWSGRGDVPVKEAVDWMNGARKNGKPFFLWLAVGSAHWPYGEDEPAHFSDPTYKGFLRIDEYPLPGPERKVVFNDTYGHVFQGQRYGNNQNIIPEDVARGTKYVADRYDDGLVKTDRILKELFDYIESSGLDSDTVIVIESEHGEDFGEHGYIAHYDITDTQTHVPLIIKIPDVPAQKVEELASGVDVFPTVLDALGVPYPQVDGVSFHPLLTGKDGSPPRTEIFLARTPLWERVIAPDEIASDQKWLLPFLELDDTEHFYDTAIRTDEWKLIHRLSRDILRQYSWYGRLTGRSVDLPEYELYDISADPLEKNNIYSENNSAVEELRGKLNEWEKKMRASIPNVQTKEDLQPYF